MDNPITSEEFIGRYIVSYYDGETIYVFDEMTYGLYKFSFELKEVSMVLPPENIFHDKDNKIMGISKSGDEIILIPRCLNSEWIFFNEKEKKIRYDVLLEDTVCISGVITTNRNLFLIPDTTCNPIIIFSLDEMKIIKIYENWHEQIRGRLDAEMTIYIWGASSYEKMIVFPMINSHYIGYINGESISMITLDIPNPIYSVSICKDKIWILPISGEYIYASDFEGNIVDRVNLFQMKTGVLASSFVRIIAAGGNVFLLPVYGGDVYTYQCSENRIVRLERKKKSLRGRFFEENPAPYWEYVIENEMLHMLQCDYHYKRINLTSLDHNEYSFSYGKNINTDQYWKMVGNIHKKCVLEKRGSDLEDFHQYTCCYYDNILTGEDRKIGRKIWKKIK